MHYAEVYIRNTRGIFTWHSENILAVGDRVVVDLRGRQKIGIVISVSSQKPTFKTAAVLEHWDQAFMPESSIQLAAFIAETTFCRLEKVLSLMIPEKFLQQRDPAKRAIFYTLVKPEVELRGAKQQALLDAFKASRERLSRDECLALASLPTLRSLEKKEIIVKETGKLNPALASNTPAVTPEITLTDDQQTAVDSIAKTDKPALLWGVTGSGKTEVYKTLARQALEKGQQTLLLLPEIALTPQLIGEFRQVFGVQLAVWHSKLSTGEKVQEWARVQSGEAKVLIGARSAILVPMPELGIVVLDEEHEWTYKNEFSPRFLTHHVAERLTELKSAKLVFGSATPRVESLHRTKTEDWNLVELSKQVFDTPPADIQIVDLHQETKKGNYGPISERLAEALAETVEQGRQAVLFLNKRGFAGATMCRHCGETLECPDCTANMKVHGYQDPKLICHICSHLEGFPDHCPHCGQRDFKFQGWGTEQVEKWLQEHLPAARVLRADRDTVTGKHDFENLTKAFKNHEADILLGTQMVAKGLDFAKVDLVGVILADVGLNLPDFRSEERVFQLLTQVAGRAGRRDRPGQILVQTFRPDEPLFAHLIKRDVKGFLASQTTERQALAWPPFSHIAKLTIAHPSKATAFAETKQVFEILQSRLESPHLDPLPEGAEGRNPKGNLNDLEIYWVPAFMPRTHGKYRFHVIVKSADESKIRHLLQQVDLPPLVLDLSPESVL